MRWLYRAVLAGLLLCACAPTLPAAPADVRLAAATAAPASSPTATLTASPRPTSTPTPSPTALPGPTPVPVITLAAVGDLMLARSIGAALQADPHDSPLAGIAAELRGADLAVANLECAIGTGGQPAAKSYTFLAPPAAAGILADAGIDLVALANNHSLDYGVAALAETMQLLDAAGIRYAGAGFDAAAARAPVVLEVRGLRLAFLAYVHVPVEWNGFDTATWEAGDGRPGLAWARPEQVAADVAAARASADLVIVLLHSGYEGTVAPNDIQRANAYAAIDAGASLVIGAHPHVLQGVEHYRHGVIAYSLGNTVFDGRWPDPTGAILHVTLAPEGVRDLRWTPLALRAGRPEVATGAEGAAVLARLDQLSAQLAP